MSQRTDEVVDAFRKDHKLVKEVNKALANVYKIKAGVVLTQPEKVTVVRTMADKLDNDGYVTGL